MKVKEFLTEKNWVNHTPLNSDEACLVTAIDRCYPEPYNFRICKLIKDRLKLGGFGITTPVAEWNDSMESFEPIKAIIEELGI